MDGLEKLDWVQVPNVSYIMKYLFCDTRYVVLISNLTSVYGEELMNADIETRFNKLNSYVKMKPRVILENLKKSLKNCLIDQSDLSLKSEEDKVIITLNFRTASVLCKYDIEMNLMPVDKVMHYIIAPTVLGSLLSQKKVLALQKRISAESSKSYVSAKTVSPQDVIEPDWLKGRNVPADIIFNSFLKLQSHYKDLYEENNIAYLSSKKIKAENASTANSASPPKKTKCLQNISESSVNFMDEDGGSSLIKREEELSCSKSLEPLEAVINSTVIRKKKKVLKF